MIKADIRADGLRARFRTLSEEMARQVICEICDSFVEWVYATFGTNLDPETRLKEMTEEQRRLREESSSIFRRLEDPTGRNRCEWTPQPLRLCVYRKDAGFQIVVVSNDVGYNDVRPWIPDKYK